MSGIFWTYAWLMAFAGPISVAFICWLFSRAMERVEADLRLSMAQLYALESKYEKTRTASIHYHSELARKEAEVIYLRGVLEQKKSAPDDSGADEVKKEADEF
jgi:hypothetical protein